jgi:two-component sensor histidine kinase
MIVGLATGARGSSDTIPSPIIRHLDSLKLEGWKMFDIHEYVYNESFRLMGKSRFADAELLFDTAAMFFVSYDDFDNAARQLLSKSELLNMSERRAEALETVEPIKSWKVSDDVRILALINRATLLRTLDDPTRAEVELLNAQNIIEKTNIRTFENVLYYELSILSSIKGDFISSIEYTQKAIDIHTEDGTPFYKLRLLSQMSKLFVNIGNFERALDYHRQAYSIAKDHDMKFAKAELDEIGGMIFQRMGQLDSAKYYLKMVVGNEDPSSYKNRDWIGSRSRLAHIYLVEGQLDSALFYLPSLKSEVKPDIEEVHRGFTYKQVEAMYHRYIGELDKANEIITDLIYETQELKRPTFFLGTLKLGAQIAKDLEDEERYRKYVDQIQLIEDSLFNMRQSYKLHNIESEYRERKQEEKLNEAVMESEKRKAQMRFYLLITLGLAALAILLFILFRNNRRKSRLLKQQNETITTVLNEKEVLLKEIHHRVKNNLQIVSSMLRMQSRNLNDPEAQSALKESEARIRSMALIHQDLYQEDDLSGIAMPVYLDKLISNIQKTFGSQSSRVTVEQNIADLRLDLDTVIPLGLIINELLTNAFKHAFGEGGGRIGVELLETGKELWLTIEDDGKGYDMTKSKGGGFGLKMIKALSQKLGAEITTDTTSGTKTLLKITKFKKVV